MTRAADDDPFHLAPRCNDLARELVPEHLARLDQRAVEIDVQVRAADPAGLDVEHDVAFAEVGYRRLLELDPANALEDPDAHVASLVEPTSDAHSGSGRSDCTLLQSFAR